MNEIDLSDLSVVPSTEKPHLSDALYYEMCTLTPYSATNLPSDTAA